MNITKTMSREKLYEICESILATLPIAYYIFKGVKVEMGDDDQTYMSIIDDHIHIGFQNIETACKNAVEIKDEWELEQIIRGLFYHECSHIFLTPHIADSYYKAQMNIFEDERIETLLEKYYLGVNFKKNIYLINGEKVGKLRKPENALNKFYQVVRYRVGEKEYVDEVYRIVKSYENMTAMNDKAYYSYRADVISLYQKIADDMGESYNPYASESEFKMPSMGDMGGEDMDSEGSESESKSEKEGEKEGGKSSSKSSADSEEKSKSSCGGTISEGDEDKENSDSESGKSSDESKDGKGETKSETEINYDEHESEKPDTSFAEEAMHYNPNVDRKLDTEIAQIIRKAMKKKGLYGSYIPSTSGKLNQTTLVTGSDTGRFWKKSAMLGGKGGSSKVNINCFIDTSGSFCGDMPFVNKLLATLCRIEKQNPDMTVNVVTCSNGEKQVFGENRYRLIASGGNCLDEDVWEFMKKLTPPSARNYNIVLFDGDAWSMDCVRGRSRSEAECKKHARAFARPNTVVITDPDNESAFEQYVNHKNGAKCIYTRGNYVEHLEEQIVNVLAQLLG